MATVAETTLRKILSNARIKPFQMSYYCERRDPEFDAKCMMSLLSTSRLKCSLTRMEMMTETGNLEIDSPDKMELLWDALKKKGFTERQLELVMRENACRVIKDTLG